MAMCQTHMTSVYTRRICAMTTTEDKVVDAVLTSTLSKRKIEEDDPFNLKLKDVRKLRGLSRNYIRKADREAKKGYYGKDGAKSKQITDEVFYGYGYLDLITPPYNLD